MAPAPLGFKTLRQLPGIYVTEDAVTDSPQDVENALRVIMVYWEKKADVAVTLEQLWDPADADHRGVLCFLPKLPQDWDKFYTRIQSQYLNNDARNRARYLLWIEDPDAQPSASRLPVTRELQVNNGRSLPDRVNDIVYASSADIEFPLLNGTFAINHPKSLAGVQHVELNDDKNGLKITNGPLHFTPTAEATAEPVALQEIDLTLTFEEQGNFVFDIAFNNRDLAGVDAGLRYFWQDSDQQVQSQRYPVFDPASNPAGSPTTIPLVAHLDPWFAYDPIEEGNIVDPRRNYYDFGVQPNESQPPTLATFFRTNLGRRVSLVPTSSGQTPSKLLFAVLPNNGQQAAPKLLGTQPTYLIATGSFTIEADQATIQLMCGLSGTEFALVQSGDSLEFVQGQPAFAQNFHGPSADTTTDACPNSVNNTTTPAPLSNRWTTSWIRLTSAVTSTSDDAINFGYCVQPLTSTYFGTSPDGGSNEKFSFPIALGCRISDLADPAPGTMFPMVPYAGVEDSSEESIFAQLERTAISVARREEVNVDQRWGPVFFDLLSNKRLAGGYVTTPQGLLVHLNAASEGAPSGTWERLELARSPINDAQSLAINKGNNVALPDSSVQPSQLVISPVLSNALMNDQLFLIASSDRYMKGFTEHELQLGEFPFNLNLADESTKAEDVGQQTVILLFKFATARNVCELVRDTATWQDADRFVGESSVQASLQQTLLGMLEEIVKQHEAGNTLFAALYERITDPEWTGILALNAGLDAQKMPADLQMLLGGIDGQLRSFDFGITVNRIDGEQTADWSIGRSSLFGLINYDKAFVDPAASQFCKNGFCFQVLQLHALFENSALSHFDARVGVRLPSVFEDNVALTAGSDEDLLNENVIVINGVYVKNPTQGTGDKPKEPGSIRFDSKKTRTFSFHTANTTALRVLDNVFINDADLLPISAAPDGDATIVTSAFKLVGDLDFGSDVKPNSGVDLFSYGNADSQTGLGFSGYNIAMTTRVTDVGQLQSIGPRFDEVQIDTSSGSPRASSLIATLPMTMTGFQYGTDGLAPQNFRQVQGDDVGLSATHPVFALGFKMKVGSLGALVTKHNKLNAQLLLGWKPGEADNQPDEVGFVFVPPAQIADDNVFHIEGILQTIFKDVDLNRIPLTDADDSPLLYVLTLTDIDFTLFDLSLIALLGGSVHDVKRNLSFFGDPNEPAGSNLSWVLDGECTSHSPADFGIVYDSTAILLAGVDVQIPTTKVNVVGPTIAKISTICVSSSSTTKSIQDMKANQGVLSYNPDGGIVFILNLTLFGVSLSVLVDDSSFYGALLTIGPANKPSGGGGGAGGGGAGAGGGGGAAGGSGGGGILSTLAGLQFEITYRRVNDHLGVFSVLLTLPKKFRVIKMSDEVTIVIPTFGLEIFTNSDFKLTIGWPLPSATSFATVTPAKIQITIEVEGVPIPLEGVAGCYLAKLRSEDAPSVFGNEFSSIWMAGLALGFGFGKQGKTGPITWDAEAYIFATLQGMLASKQGGITTNGVDYFWVAGSLGVTVIVKGGVHWKIINVDLSLQATLVITAAIETDHYTEIVGEAQFKIELKASIAFITVRFRTRLKVRLFTFKLFPGKNECPALSSGPTPLCGKAAPQALTAQPLTPQRLAAPVASPPSATAAPTASIAAAAPTVGRSVVHAATPEFLAQVTPEANASTTPPIELHVMLQPTSAHVGGAWQPQAVVSLVIEYVPDLDNAPSTPPPASAFVSLCQGIAHWLLTADAYKSNGSLAEQLAHVAQTLEARIQDGDFANDIQAGLNEKFTFNIRSADALTSAKTAAVFPLFPQLSLSYNGGVVTDNKPLPSDYLQTVEKYFSTFTDSESVAASTTDTTLTQLLFDDYFATLATQLIRELQDATGATDINQALAQIKFENIAGLVTRSRQGGLRLPDPSNPTKLTPVDVLTHQQIQLVKTPAKAWDTTITLSVAKGAHEITLGPDSSSSLDVSLKQTDVVSGPVQAHWLASDVQATPALRTFDRQVMFSTRNTATLSDGTAKVLPLFPQTLAAELATGPSVQLRVFSLASDQTMSSPAMTAQQAAPALFIPLRLRQVQDPQNPSGPPLTDVFQLIGTDDETRQMLDELLRNAPGTIGSVSLFTSPAGTNYTAVPQTANVELAKTNLANISHPQQQPNAGNGKKPELASPTHASLADAENFLWLVWEVSIVNAVGFYMHIEGLKSDSFKGSEAILGLLVELGAPAHELVVSSHHNVLVMDPAAAEKPIVANLFNAAGQLPLIGYAQNHPVGDVGFEITTASADDATVTNPTGYLRSLYHVVQFRVESVTGENNFAATNWSLPNTQNNTDEGKWFYRREVAVDRLLGKASPYDVMGRSVTLGLSAGDIFGNTLPESDSTTLQATVQYNDPLQAVTAWRAVKSHYRFVEANAKDATLQIELSFDPSQIHAFEQNVDEAIAQAIAHFTTIRDQLADASAFVTVSSTLSPVLFKRDTARTGEPYHDTVDDDGTTVHGKLNSFVDKILQALRDKTTTPLTESVNLSFAKSFVASLPGDVEHVKVFINTVRKTTKETADPAVLAKVPEIARVSGEVAAELPSVADETNSDGQAGDNVALRQFALGFEAAFANFDGHNGQLKVAVGPAKGQQTKRTDDRDLWAVRWGAGSGVGVTFGNAQGTAADRPIYFAPAPLSTELITATLNIKDYKLKGNQFVSADVERTFSLVDMDDWGRSFLDAVGEIFSPDMASAIAKLSEHRADRYQQLIDCKETLAEGISKGLQNVFVIDDGKGDKSVRRGDATQAQRHFFQSLLASVASDYQTAALVQVPAEVSTKAAVDGSFPPNLSGPVSDNKQQPSETKSPYTLGNSRLPLAGDKYLDFLVAAAPGSELTPDKPARLDLDLFYDVRFLEHEFVPDEEMFGYIPSSWLSFVLPVTDPAGTPGSPVLDTHIGKVEIPLPLRDYPGGPRLVRQTATQDFGRDQQLPSGKSDSLSKALTWTYGVEVNRPAALTDDLYVQVSFNEPIDGSTTTNDGSPQSAQQDVTGTLFEALAQFMTAYPVLQPQLRVLRQAAFHGGNTALADAVLDLLTELVCNTASLWQSWVEAETPSSSERLGTTGKAWTYRVTLVQETDNLEVERIKMADGQLPPWPTIAGFTAPRGTAATGTYTLDAATPPATLALHWPKLFIMTHQSAKASVLVERNVDLAGPHPTPGTQTNSAFIYRTAPVTFASPIVPRIDVVAPQTLASGTSLQSAISDIFNSFTKSNGATVDTLNFSLASSYGFRLGTDTSADALVGRTPVFLVQREATTNGSGSGNTKLSDVEQELGENFNTWQQDAKPEGAAPDVILALTVFADASQGQLPLVTFSELRIPVPAKASRWW